MHEMKLFGKGLTQFIASLERVKETLTQRSNKDEGYEKIRLPDDLGFSEAELRTNPQAQRMIEEFKEEMRQMRATEIQSTLQYFESSLSGKTSVSGSLSVNEVKETLSEAIKRRNTESLSFIEDTRDPWGGSFPESVLEKNRIKAQHIRKVQEYTAQEVDHLFEQHASAPSVLATEDHPRVSKFPDGRNPT